MILTKLKIDDKEFTNFKFSGEKYSGEIMIIPKNIEDILYFKEWFDRALYSTLPKCTYVKDIIFEGVISNGKIYNCFPIGIDFNGKNVTLKYDYIKEIK